VYSVFIVCCHITKPSVASDTSRRREDADERDESRAGLLGDGPAPRPQYFQSSYDAEEEEDYYYDNNEQNYDDDDTAAAADNADNNYAEGNSADIELSLY